VIYDTPKILPAGDRYVLVEFGNEMNLELNFRAQSLAGNIRDAGIHGIIESAPCFASLLVHYDPEKLNLDDVSRILSGMFPSAELSSSAIELKSRLFYLPTLYLDPWTKACVDDYCLRISPKVPDPELVVQENCLQDSNHLIRVHSSSEYWVASLGFWPGLPFLMALDPRARLTAPKYNPPRTNTPKGAIGLGGAANSIYPVATPGGYQIFARTPVPIWDNSGRYPGFDGQLCLFKPGDRIRFVPVAIDEYEEIERLVAENSYVPTMVDYQKFVVADYQSWTAEVQKEGKR